MDNALRELYQDVILDHSRHPRHYGVLDHASHKAEGYNPLCGDRVTVRLKTRDGVIDDVRFEGRGCAISIASASLMTEALRGRTEADAATMFARFHALVTGQESAPDASLGKLEALGGVAEFPTRVKCAMLPWHALQAALRREAQPVSTED